MERLLEGISVLDLAEAPDGFCAMLLADLGAAVLRVERPGGHSAKSAASFVFHNANKRSIAIDLQDRRGRFAFRRLIRTPDVLVESFRPGHLEALGLGCERLQRLNPRLVHLSITGFGQTGPKSSYAACDGVCAAFGGQMSVSGTFPDRPLKLPGPQTHYTAGLFGANAVLLNLRKRERTGRGCHIDLSIQEAAASTLGHVLIDYFHDGTVAERRGDAYAREPFTILPCRDGFIQIPILRNWETLRELMASDGKGPALRGTRWDDKTFGENHYGRAVKSVEAWTRDRPKQELFELGQSMGFPWAPLESFAEVRKSPQLEARKFFVRAAPAKGRPVSLPRPPYKLRPGPAAASAVSEKASRPSAGSGDILRGIRVLDLTRMLSGPYATRILGDFGAEVIKVQSVLTATGAERNGTPAFLALNRNKRSIGLNLNRAEARGLLLELAAISDVVVENYSPRVLANWGLSYNRLKTAKPDLIMASVSAMGQTGPWKNYVGFAPTFHALSGLTAATARSGTKPAGIGFAYGDIVTGLYAALAILAAIRYRDRTGRGQYIDLSAYEAVCSLMPPADDCGNAAPCGCYPCAGRDRWCVVAVCGNAQWKALCKILDIREGDASRFATPELRRRHREELDRLVCRSTAGGKAEHLVRRLQKAGVAAGLVQNAADLAKDPQLAARHFFVSMGDRVRGKNVADRSALWPWDEKPAAWKAAPAFGEDTHYVLVELLGRSEQEFQTLLEKGIADGRRKV